MDLDTAKDILWGRHKTYKGYLPHKYTQDEIDEAMNFIADWEEAQDELNPEDSLETIIEIAKDDQWSS